MPEGALTTLPWPCFVTTRLNPCGAKVAVTDLLLVMDTEHVPVPVHTPLQPVKVDPAAAVAVKFTEAPLEYTSEQSAPHEIPAGELVTEPLPVPKLVIDFTRLTDSVKV